MLRKLFQAILQPGLRDRVRALEARMEEVDVEWLDWYNKFKSLYARLAKAEIRSRAAGNGEPEPSEDDGERPPVPRRRMNQLELAQLVRRNRGVLRPPVDEPR